MLAALMSYYGFLALFPLLLLLVTILGYTLKDNPSLQDRVLQSTLSDLPVIGDQLRANIHSLNASPVATVIGAIGLLWGSLGVTQAAQFAMAQVWNVEGKDRPGFLTRLVRGLLFIGTLGLGIALTTLFAQVGAFSSDQAMWLRVVSIAAGVALNIGVYILAFRVLTPRQIETRLLVPGAVLGGIGWTLLQFVGTYLVDHQLKHSSQVYGLFAVVLGLVAWLYLNAQLTMYAAEFNVVAGAASLAAHAPATAVVTRRSRGAARHREARGAAAGADGDGRLRGAELPDHRSIRRQAVRATTCSTRLRPSCLARYERGVGFLQHFLRRLDVTGIEDREAGAEGDDAARVADVRDRRAPRARPACVPPPARPSRATARERRRGTRRRRSGRPRRRPGPARCSCTANVWSTRSPAEVAVGVVVRLEVVDVEHGHAIAVRVAHDARLEQLEVLFEGAPVAEAGERVLARERRELVVHEPQLVGRRADLGGHARASAAALRRGSRTRPPSPAAPPAARARR